MLALACLAALTTGLAPATAAEVAPAATATLGPLLGPVPRAAADAAPADRVSAAPDVRVPVTGPVASLVAPVPPATLGRRRRAGDAALLRAAGVDPAAVGYTVDFLPGRAGLRGLTFPSQHRIEMYVRADHDVDDVLRVLTHELGHAVSETCLTGSERAAYEDVRGLGGAGTRPRTGVPRAPRTTPRCSRGPSSAACRT